MTMQRRHFELIAETIREINDTGERAEGMISGTDVAYLFAARLNATNPNFNRDRFLRACGVEG